MYENVGFDVLCKQNKDNFEIMKKITLSKNGEMICNSFMHFAIVTQIQESNVYLSILVKLDNTLRHNLVDKDKDQDNVLLS